MFNDRMKSLYTRRQTYMSDSVSDLASLIRSMERLSNASMPRVFKRRQIVVAHVAQFVHCIFEKE